MALTGPVVTKDLLLLLTDDDSGRHLVDNSTLELVLGGGLLIDLANLDRIAVSEASGVFRRATVTVTDPSPVDDEILNQALAACAERPRSASDLVARLGKEARLPILERLAGRGILRMEQGRVLGMFPSTRWPADDSRHELEVRQGLFRVLVSGQEPNSSQAALISLLASVDRIPKVVTDSGVSASELKKRAKTIAAGDFAGEAVADAIAAVIMAASTAIFAATTASS